MRETHVFLLLVGGGDNVFSLHRGEKGCFLANAEEVKREVENLVKKQGVNLGDILVIEGEQKTVDIVISTMS